MNKPNLIFIVSDQHRGDWLGCAGSRIVQTPNLDHMAQEGVHFTQAYCNSPLCVPSRMSMMTGRHPHNTRVYANDDHLSSDIPTFAHALGLGGYETVLCGRMHFVGPDQRHGYQQRLVGDITPCYLGGPKTPYGDLEGTSGQGLTSIRKAGPGTSPVQQYDEEVVTACERFLAERSSTNVQPLFLTVGFYGPHHPYTCPPDLYEQALAAMEKYDDPIPRDQLPRHPWLSHWFERLQADQITTEQLRGARACYAGNISLLDQYVGRIRKAVESLTGDTWLVYVSDHGDMAGDRGMFWKRSFYEGALRIPMIWYPYKQTTAAFKIARGRTVDVPVSLLDLAPTFTKITKSPELPSVDGADLSPLLDGEKQVELVPWEQRPLFAELANAQDSATRMVVVNNMKLVVHYGFEPVRLFDLKRDPHERNDLGELPEYKEIRDKLLQLVFQDWNPQQIMDYIEGEKSDLSYLTLWGKQVGMGPSDLWNYDLI